MFLFQIIQDTQVGIEPSDIDKILHYVEKNVPKKQKGHINIVFVAAKEIQALNAKYRNKDQVTDVLSFHYFDDFEPLKDEQTAGEVILCLDKIIEDAEINAVSQKEQTYMLIIHSLLHILGYDHENQDDYKIMHELEKSIYREAFGKNFDEIILPTV